MYISLSYDTENLIKVVKAGSKKECEKALYKEYKKRKDQMTAEVMTKEDFFRKLNKKCCVSCELNNASLLLLQMIKM